MNKIAEMENKLKRDDLINNIGNRKKDKRYNFQKFEAKRKRNLYDSLEQQLKLKDDINNFKESSKPKESVKKNKKKQNTLTLQNAIILLNSRQIVLMLLKMEYSKNKTRKRTYNCFGWCSSGSQDLKP